MRLDTKTDWLTDWPSVAMWLWLRLVHKEEVQCGGGFEYLHRSPASRRKWRRGNPVPGGITGPPCSRGILIQGSVPPGWENLESEAVIWGYESRGIRIWEWLRWRGPAEIVNDRPILSSERMLHKHHDHKGSVEKNLWSWVSKDLTPSWTD
jgi:hypothetical protein